MNDYQELLEQAKKVANNSYSPYSNFRIGTALLTKNGKIYTGCNVENHGIQSICGERTAFTKAISEGEPTNNPENYIAIMVVGYDEKENKYVEALPCGYCRQFMSEFTNSEFKILTYDGNTIHEYKIKDLLPYSFKM